MKTVARLTPGQRQILDVMDGEWKTGKELADRASVSRRAVGQQLQGLKNKGLVESRRVGVARSPRSDPPPHEWRKATA